MCYITFGIRATGYPLNDSAVSCLLRQSFYQQFIYASHMSVRGYPLHDLKHPRIQLGAIAGCNSYCITCSDSHMSVGGYTFKD